MSPLRLHRSSGRGLSDREVAERLAPLGQGVMGAPVGCPVNDDIPGLSRLDGDAREQEEFEGEREASGRRGRQRKKRRA